MENESQSPNPQKGADMELAAAYNATIEGWMRALELRDKEAEGQSQRVTQLTMMLAMTMNTLSSEELIDLQRGALLHGIGKMGVPDSILRKPEPLTEAETQILRREPVYAYELLAPIAYLRQAADIPYCCHENWDGSGYPRGLKGEQIPIGARMVAVVLAWDTLCSSKPFRPALPVSEAAKYLQEQSGKMFDPAIVEAFLKITQR